MKQRYLLTIISIILLSSCKNVPEQKKEEDIKDPTPLFSYESGFYDSPINLKIQTSSDYEIYYTLDGSRPTRDSLRYNNGIYLIDNSSASNRISMVQNISNLDVYYPEMKIDKCHNIKAIAINKEGIETDVIEKNYFINYQNKEGCVLPLVNLSMNYDDLFDYERGIYVKGKVFDESEETTYPEEHEANYTQHGKEWEREAHLTYYDKNKHYSFNQDIGVRIHGGWSRAFNQKSFNLYARKEYSGTNSFEKPFFGGKKLKTCMLRSGGYRDTFVTKSRDSLIQKLSNKYSFDNQNSYPVNVFLNGEYWGVYNLQQRFSDSYIEEKYNIDKDNIIIVKNDEYDDGIEEAMSLYEEFKEFLINHNFITDMDYQLINQYIDVDEFISYMGVELYVGNIDWPGNNVRLWRSINSGDHPLEDNRWHFMMYDTDDSSNMLDYKCSPSHNPFLNTNHWKYGPLDDRCILGLILTKLLENNTFKQKFITFIKDDISETFSPNNVNKYLDNRVLDIKKAMVKNYQRFVNKDYNEQYLLSEIDKIKEFYQLRKDHMVSFLNDL